MIIFNADDFGYSKNENILIDNAFQSGIIKSSTVLPNFILPSIKYNLQSIGIHLNLVEGRSITKCRTLTSEQGYFFDKKTLLKKFLTNQIDLKELRNEIHSQILLLIKHGFNLSHADSHQSIHSFPVVYKIYAEELEKFGIYKIRNVISKYNFFNNNIYLIRNIIHYIIGFRTVRKFNVLSPDYVIVKAPGLGNPNLTLQDSLALWEYGLKHNYNSKFIYECPCHLGLSNLEVELYNSKEFFYLLNKYHVKVGNYFDLN